MSQSELVESARLAVENSVDAKTLDETLQLARRGRTLEQVDEVGFDATFGEEAQCLASVSALPDTEDLDFHRIGLRVKKKPGAYKFGAPWWLRNPHAQTMWGRFFKRVRKVQTRREMVRATDGDELELHHLDAAAGVPRVLLLHGLEGSRDSHYVDGMLAHAADRGWGATLLVFRGCGSAPNLAARFYHSGETSDVDFVFTLLADRWPHTRWFGVGVSLGGNVLLKWLGERGSLPRLAGAVAISTPFDLDAGARHISHGFARLYDRNFVRSLRRKALAKLERRPGLFDESRLRGVASIYDFDDTVTAPVHGFESAADYYAKSSSLGFLRDIRVPTLLLSAYDDPFLPPRVLDQVEAAISGNPSVVSEFHSSGGHVGFVSGRPWRPFYYAEWRAFRFFDDIIERESR
ncbi:MAG TPA: alpha/beta fold hydrolase [Gemmatimonadaceae bacterium]|nr:alpha/beta fold hydrolase [Gemmatimonadaceae bacterium]